MWTFCVWWFPWQNLEPFLTSFGPNKADEYMLDLPPRGTGLRHQVSKHQCPEDHFSFMAFSAAVFLFFWYFSGNHFTTINYWLQWKISTNLLLLLGCTILCLAALRDEALVLREKLETWNGFRNLQLPLGIDWNKCRTNKTVISSNSWRSGLTRLQSSESRN